MKNIITESSLAEWDKFEENCEIFMEQVKKYECEVKTNAELKTDLSEKEAALQCNKVCMPSLEAQHFEHSIMIIAIHYDINIYPEHHQYS